MPRVLIADTLSPAAGDVFESNGIDTDVRTGLDEAALAKVIGGYDGLAVRSATQVTADVLACAEALRVIGRAGIGVDNIDVPAATAKGIVVMNTPFGNAITTAEHAIALILALARHIPGANASTHAGKWEKSRFMGIEITDKTLGIIGCGNIGSIVADRARGLKMRVIVHDPFLPPERMRELGVEKVALEELLSRADFITLHTPLTPRTRHMINAAALARVKPGVRIVNCARHGLVVDEDLKDALESGRVGGAALDVFAVEPARQNILFGMPGVICTPHLGASTTEAQEKVAVQVASQMSDHLLRGAVANAVNMPSISAEEAPLLRPFRRLSSLLGSFVGQLAQSAPAEVTIEYQGEVAAMNRKALTAAALAGILHPVLDSVNMVNAPVVAQVRGIRVSEVSRGRQGAYETYIRLTIKTENRERSIAGTVFSGGRPRIIQVDGINMEAEPAPHMLYVVNRDKPGFIGLLGTVLGAGGVNIAAFSLGRREPGGIATALVQVDEPVPDGVMEDVRALEHVVRARRLHLQEA